MEIGVEVEFARFRWPGENYGSQVPDALQGRFKRSFRPACFYDCGRPRIWMRWAGSVSEQNAKLVRERTCANDFDMTPVKWDHREDVARRHSIMPTGATDSLRPLATER